MPTDDPCISCLRGFYDECGHEPPSNDESLNIPTGNETTTGQSSEDISGFDSNDLGEPLDREIRKRRTKPDDAVRDQQSTGRKRAARRYPLHREELCEWAEASEDNHKGGGNAPVTVPCFKTQQARHHGPDKNTLNNEPGNVHRICVAPETRILMHDLTWRFAFEILPNDKVIGFTESLLNPKFEFATVEAVGHVVKPSQQITTDRGTLISSNDHTWVTSKRVKDNHIVWRRSDLLIPGLQMRYIVKPWVVDKSWEAGWLAGILDGEGTINKTQIGVSQKYGPIADLIKLELEKRIQRDLHIALRDRIEEHHSLLWNFRIANLQDILTVLGTVRPHRLLTEFYTKYKLEEKNPLLIKDNKITIREVKPIQRQHLISIQTSSRTFIAEGFLSHNCHFHHNLWHRNNDPNYDPNKPLKD